MIALLFAVLAAQAQIPGYQCTIRILAKDLPGVVAETTIFRPFSTPQSHGGTPYEFAAGEHRVGVVADAKWRGIIWQRAGVDVAQVLTAGTAPITGNAVMILNNPKDLEEAVHLECDPAAGQFPRE